jgi:probable selenium-dependent hydroxylase accessory protein YqeC
MKLFESLDIDLTQNELICFIGAGGKTTSLLRLARELKGCNKRVLVTTTTAIFCPDEGECDEVITGIHHSKVFGNRKSGACIVAMGSGITPDNKLLGVERSALTEFHQEKLFDYILVEADGSRQRPIKAPADHEPVIPSGTTKTVGVIGLDALGKQIDATAVHRPELLCRHTAKVMGAIIDEDVIARLIRAPQGLFKSVPEESQRYVVLNKVENSELQQSARCIIASVKSDFPGIQGFIVANMLEGNITRVDE